MTQPNERAVMLGFRLQHVIAKNVTAGIEQLQAERRRALVSGPDKTEVNGHAESAGTSTTERQAEEGYRLGLLIEDLRDALRGAKIAVDHLDHLAADACRTRAFAPLPRSSDIIDKISEVPTCGQGQIGRHGVEEWGDEVRKHTEFCPPDCDDLHRCGLPATKDGLCDRHYMAMYRFRVKNQRPVADLFMPGLDA